MNVQILIDQVNANVHALLQACMVCIATSLLGIQALLQLHRLLLVNVACQQLSWRDMALYSSTRFRCASSWHNPYSGSHVASEQALTMNLAGPVPKPLSFSTLEAVYPLSCRICKCSWRTKESFHCAKNCIWQPFSCAKLFLALMAVRGTQDIQNLAFSNIRTIRRNSDSLRLCSQQRLKLGYLTCQPGQGDPGRGDIAQSLQRQKVSHILEHESFGIAELSEVPTLPASRANHLLQYLQASHILASDTDVTNLCQFCGSIMTMVPIDQDQRLLASATPLLSMPSIKSQLGPNELALLQPFNVDRFEASQPSKQAILAIQPITQLASSNFCGHIGGGAPGAAG